MKNKTIIWILVVVSILGTFLLLGQNKANDNQNQLTKTENEFTENKNRLMASEVFYDFGDISMKDGNVSTIFKVVNKSDSAISISSIETSCMCTTAYIFKEDGSKKGPFGMAGHSGSINKTNELILPGDMRDIEVVYDPNAHGPAGVGMIDRFILLRQANGEKIQLEIKANVAP